MPETGLCFLGFDCGKRRIGVAVGQRITASAEPLVTLNNSKKNGKPRWDLIDKLIQEWQPDGLVVGLPLRQDGSDSKSTEMARDFIQQLQGRYSLPVHGIDETLTSHAAEDYEAVDRVGLDAVAAQLILETWFADIL